MRVPRDRVSTESTNEKSSSKKAKYTGETEKRLIAYFHPYWQLLAGGLLCTVLIKGIDLLFAFLIGDLLKAAIEKQPNLLNWIALSIVGIYLVKWVLAYGQTYLISSATQKIAVRLRNDLYSHLQALSLSFFERTKVGHLMSRMTNDVGLIQNSANQIIDIVSAPIGIISSLVAIFVLNWRLALISVVVMPFMSYAVVRISRGMKRLTELVQIRLADVAAVVQETLSAMQIVKSFGMEDYETSRFADENQRTYGAAMRAVRRSAAMSPTLEFIGVTGIAFVLWYGGHMVAQNQMSGFDASDMVTFLLLLKNISDSARIIGRLNITYHQTMAGAQRIFDILNEVPEIKDNPGASVLPPISGKVEFKNVWFSYNGKNHVLKDVSFTIEPGQQVALVGPSGAGKSTVADLIPRFYDVSQGMVCIDGVDIRNVTLQSLRQQIAIVPQETILFSTSIRENIAYGRMNATEEEITEAAQAANAHEFIVRLPNGYDTLVGERGTKLSGGERQRVAIARALLKNPRLLILDEATSSLDTASEAIVQEALERLMRNRTTLVIAHRLSTVVNADKILVMNEGRIVQCGTHDELLAQGGLYAELYTIQTKTATA